MLVIVFPFFYFKLLSAVAYRVTPRFYKATKKNKNVLQFMLQLIK